MVAWLALHATPARADEAQPHVDRGEELAREGRLTEAIQEFKRADAIEPRASNACLIALAYIRRELWPQAEVFLTTCHDRAKPSDPLPDWVALAEQQLANRLENAHVARVTILVEPPALTATTTLQVSSFAPDELFGPRTIHLPLGKHLITARVPGHDKVERAIDITDGSSRTVVISFAKSEVHVTTHHDSPLPKLLMATGAAAIVAGVVVHVFAFRPARDHLEDAANPAMPDPALYDEWSGKFDTRRELTIGLYAGGAVLAITGYVLQHTVFADSRTQSPQLSAVVGGGGMVVGVSWLR